MAGPRRKTAGARDQGQQMDKGKAYRKLRLQIAVQLMPDAHNLTYAARHDAIQSALELAEQLIWQNEIDGFDEEMVNSISILK